MIQFRKDLDLSIKEFSDLFQIAPATVHRIETNKSSGKDTLKRIEIYERFPEVSLFEIERNGHRINDKKRKNLIVFFKNKLEKK